jgi:protein TorT
MKRRLIGKIVLAAVAVAVPAMMVVHDVRNEPAPKAVLAASADAILIDGFYGRYDPGAKDTDAGPSGLRGPVRAQWPRRTRPKRPYRIGVLFPNREENDVYWKAVRIGVQEQAAAEHVAIDLVSSDDYTHVAQHQQQFEALARSGVDAIVIGAIDYRAMDTLVQRAAAGEFGKKIPVVAVVNDIYAPAISGKVRVAFYDMGRIAGQYVYDRAVAAAGERSELSVAFFPGPINSGWAPDSLRGFLSVIRQYPGDLRIIAPEWGNTDAKTQNELVNSVLEKNPSIDYIVANGVAASAAVRILRATGRENDVHIISTYYNYALDPDIRSGRILAAPWDQTEALGRIAVGMSIRILNGERPGRDFPFDVGPAILMRSRS